MASVEAQLNYLAPGEGPVQVRAYPPSSGLANAVPPALAQRVTIEDARSISGQLRLDEQGFELHAHASTFDGYYDAALVRERYYPEVRALMRQLTGALDVIV